MRADNSRHVVEAARRRGQLTRSKAVQALRAMDAAGEPITFETVAQRAQVQVAQADEDRLLEGAELGRPPVELVHLGRANAGVSIAVAVASLLFAFVLLVILAFVGSRPRRVRTEAVTTFGRGPVQGSAG